VPDAKSLLPLVVPARCVRISGGPWGGWRETLCAFYLSGPVKLCLLQPPQRCQPGHGGRTALQDLTIPGDQCGIQRFGHCYIDRICAAEAVVAGDARRPARQVDVKGDEDQVGWSRSPSHLRYDLNRALPILPCPTDLLGKLVPLPLPVTLRLGFGSGRFQRDDNGQRRPLRPY
jgi:hypothetical protein